MTNSKASLKGRRSERLWLPSLLLLLGQFLTITPVLVIIFSDEQQRRASDAYASLLDGLDRLSFAIADLENSPVAWQQEYATYRNQLGRVLSSSTVGPEIRDNLAKVDSDVQRMAGEKSGPAALQSDARSARSELLNAQRAVQVQLFTAGNNVTQRTTYLKALVAGACLLAFCVVLVIRRFRIDATIQTKLQQELRRVNEEVVAALAVARSESEAKSQYLANVGRLMRTPLHGILSRTGELLETELTDRQRNCAQSSRELAESLKKVADQAVDYSKMESGRFELDSVEFDPANVVTEVLQLFRSPAEGKDLRLKSASGKSLPGAVKGDPGVLRQVLVNLLSNAVRFTEQGEVSLSIEEVTGPPGRTSLRFKVKDTGIGMTEEVRDRIFEPFVRERGLRAHGNEGTGLGLAISKKLVERIGGKIEVDSEPGRGSTFSFTAVFETVRVGTEQQREASEAASSSLYPNTGPAVEDRRQARSSHRRTDRRQGRDRRTEPRHGINYPTLLRSEAGVAGIRVLDVSVSGLRASVPFQLDIQSEVEIRVDGASVTGIVRNCTRIAANEFHIGIEIPHAQSANEESLHHLRLLRAIQVLHQS